MTLVGVPGAVKERQLPGNCPHCSWPEAGQPTPESHGKASSTRRDDGSFP
ncbi:rCG38245 [Rattus norvegicus]|uniref:RCG38245 n=1 Tax=Rattus norvegicus TaxID=10116 RepID=A6KTJ0_RAT|nr:rCG38245 [Rattus norvegicus]